MAASNSKKQRNVRYVTATGIAVYPHLTKPDTKFNADGDYKVSLRLPAGSQLKTAKGESCGTFEDFITQQCEAELQKAKDEGKAKARQEEPFEIDEETGDIKVNFKLGAKVTTKSGESFTQKPMIVDSKGKPFKGDYVGGGSKIKISFETIPYFMASTKVASVSLRMKAVQILELATGGPSYESAGFEIEDGFDASGEEDESSDDFEADDDANDSNDGDF